MTSDTQSASSTIQSHVDDIENFSVRAEEQLSLLGDEQAELANQQEILQEFEAMQIRSDEIHRSLTDLEASQLEMHAQSNLTHAQGRLRRLQLVIKNILRISRRNLGVLDLDQVQEEISLNLGFSKPD